MADIFKVDSQKKCHVIHGDLLLINVPFTKLNSCVQALQNGKTDAKSLGAKHVFNLNANFKMESNPANHEIAMTDGTKTFVEDADEVEDIAYWLKKNLKRRYFFPSNVAVSNPRQLLKGLVAAICVSILALMLFFIETLGLLNTVNAQNTVLKMIAYHLTTKNIMFTALLVIAVIILWSLTTFIKSRTFMEVYEQGYKPADNRR